MPGALKALTKETGLTLSEVKQLQQKVKSHEQQLNAKNEEKTWGNNNSWGERSAWEHAGTK